MNTLATRFARRLALFSDIAVAFTSQLHEKSIHAVDVTWFPCNMPDAKDPTKMCSYRAKQQSHLKLHLSSMHNLGVRWFACQEPGCTYKAKQQSHLKQHFVRVHLNPDGGKPRPAKQPAAPQTKKGVRAPSKKKVRACMRGAYKTRYWTAMPPFLTS